MSAALPALPAPVSVARARFVPVSGDGMAPTLDRRHMVAVVPVEHYRCPGLYVHDFGGGPEVWRCEALAGDDDSIVMTQDNRAVRYPCPRGRFEATLLGQVAGVLRVVDSTLLEG